MSSVTAVAANSCFTCTATLSSPELGRAAAPATHDAMTDTVSIRNPAVAGMFYPASAPELKATVAGHIGRAALELGVAAPKAIIAPHAGYVYSGPIAGTAYARLAPMRGKIRRVVLAGPSHRVAFAGIAVPSVAAFAMPGGNVVLDREAIERIRALPFVHALDAAHAAEHSREVH